MNLFGSRKRRFEIEANRFGPYNVVKVIHDGEKAMVYQAKHRTDGQVVAIKAYKKDFNRAALGIRKKYGIPGEGEIGVALTKACNKKQWPICKVFGYGHEFEKSDGNEYIVMEYVDGVNLKHLVSCRHELLARCRSQIIRRIVRGLAVLHAHDLVHRDFCTDNVIVTSSVRVKIIDLGFTARAGIAFEERSGTPSYMAPEQVQAQALSPRSDIYAFGVVLYEILTCRLPFTSSVAGDSPRQIAKRHKEIMDKQVNTPPVPPRQIDPNISEHLEAAALRCLAKDPNDRFADVAELFEAIKQAEE